VNGRLGPDERALIVSSTLIAGSKKDATSVRPIAMGEAFLKLAGHYALSLVKDNLPEVLEPVQLAHSSGGPEKAAAPSSA